MWMRIVTLVTLLSALLQTPELAAVAPGEQQHRGAALWATVEAHTGEWLPVAWRGPDKRGDRVTVVPRGAADDHAGRYALTRQGNPLVLPMPTEPGDYELRYLAGGSGRLLARRGIRILAAAP